MLDLPPLQIAPEVAVGAKDGSIDGSHLARPNLDIGGWRLTALQAFWERLRRRALVDLRKAAGAIGDGVLAHVQISELEREGPAGLSNRFFGQQMMVGTVVRASGGDADLGAVRMVVDMRDGLSPLTGRRPGRHDAFDQLGEQELAL